MTLSAFRFARGPVTLVIATLLAACGGRAEEASRAAAVPEVLTAPATAAEKDAVLRLPARIRPGEAARIYPRATGFIERRFVDIGDPVEAGAVLAVISTPEADELAREAQAMLAKAKADEDLARLNHSRARALVRSGVVSEEMYSDRRANLDVAVAARAAAAARLAAARERQAFQSVRAPFAGTVVARNIERGDRVTADAADAQPLFEIHALDPLRVVVDVPQSMALQVRPGMEGEVTFPELPGESLRASVVRSSGTISTAAGMMRVEMRLSNPGGRIPAGMVGTVTLRLPRPTPALVVPNAAVVRGADGSRVAIVDAGRLEYRDVTVGRNLGDTIEIRSGLAAGDTVVLSPNALLRSGVRVKARALAGAEKRPLR